MGNTEKIYNYALSFAITTSLPLPVVCIYSNHYLGSLAFCLNISCQAGVLSKNSLRFYLGMFLFLKANFTGYKILIWQYFTFNTLTIPSQWLLASIVFIWKVCCQSYWGVLVCDEFSFIVFMILSLSLTHNSFALMCLGMDLFVYHTWCLLSFLVI